MANHLDSHQKDQRASIAMTVTLISLGMLFASLMLGYTVLRFQQTEWPPMGIQPVPLLWPTMSTIIIVLSSFFMFEMQRTASREFKSNELSKNFYLTLLTGFAFIGFQFKLWSMLKQVGIYADSGIFGSILYAFTWIHAGHIVVGLLGFFAIWIGIRKNIENSDLKRRVSVVAKLWHFLAIVWMVLYLVLFVV